jgi:hypothetical protein
MGDRLQRAQGLWWSKQCQANGPADPTARFWFIIVPAAYHPFARQLVTAKQMSIVDSARFMALVAVALNDALIAVMDAKYPYNFWRPITAIPIAVGGSLSPDSFRAGGMAATAESGHNRTQAGRAGPRVPSRIVWQVRGRTRLRGDIGRLAGRVC